MTVSKPLSIVLQLIALGMFISAGYTAQQEGDFAAAAPTAIFALIILVLSRMKAKPKA